MLTERQKTCQKLGFMNWVSTHNQNTILCSKCFPLIFFLELVVGVIVLILMINLKMLIEISYKGSISVSLHSN